MANTVIEQDDYQKIIKLLEESDPFVLSPSNVKGKYKIDQYRLASVRGDLRLKVLLDNNIFTRILPLAKGDSLEVGSQSDKATGLACAIMSFFIMGGFDIEFTLPLYERAYCKSKSSRGEDLYYFRVADNLHPQVYADVALGKKDCFPSHDLEFAKNMVDKEYPPMDCSLFDEIPVHWKHIYIKLLKACAVWKDTQSNMERVKRYIQWVRENSLFIPATESFVLLFFSENRLSKMIKGINSNNKEKLIQGARNAAWDLLYITYWAEKAEKEQGKTIWFICSNDKVLKKIAESIFIVKSADRDSFLGGLFEEYWGEKNGMQVLEIYKALENEVKSEKVKRDKFIEELELHLDSDVHNYEQAIRT